jgi:hypothetical protein
VTTPRLALPHIVQSQAQKEVTHNEALNRLDMLVQAAVLDRHRTTAPEAPGAGNCHLVASGATGAWAGHGGHLACWYGTAWVFIVPQPGFLIFVVAEGLLLLYRDGEWRTAGGASGTTISQVTGLQGALDARQPLDQTLTALAGLAVSASTIIRATGEDSFDLVPLSAFMAGLLATAGAASLLSAIGGMPASGGNVAGRLAIMGAPVATDPLPYPGVLKSISASHKRLAGAVVARLTPVPAADELTTASGVFPGSLGFYGGVLLMDGRVFCVPYKATAGRLYDPVTDTLATTASGGFPGSDAFGGGVLLADGRVFCIPLNSTSARIYDPATETTTTPPGTFPGSNAFLGGVLLPDGRVFCAPFNATTARIYDPASNTLVTPSGTYPGSGAFAGAVLMADGRVYCVPRGATAARIYDPVSDTLATPSGSFPGGSGFSGGVLLADGRVFCVPYSSTTARIYDPVANTLTTPGGTYPGNTAFNGGVLLPDGRVFCVPLGATAARIYDPAGDTLATPPGTYPGGSAYSGGVLTPNGRVFCVPRSATSAVLAVGAYSHRSLNFPLPLLLGGTLNSF